MTLTVKRIPALPQGSNAVAGYRIAVWNSSTNETQQFDVSEFISEVQSGNYDWSSVATYGLNEVVFYNQRLWASLQVGNLNHVPQEDTWWTEVVKGQASGLKSWAAGAYTADEVFIVHDPGSGNNIYELTNVTRPYLSNNITTEIAGGDWEPFSLSVSNITYDGSRVIKKLPSVGDNLGTANITDFLDEAYFPELPQTIDISNQPIIEVGVSHAPNIVGVITPNDAIISARRVREVIGDTIEANPAGDAVNETLSAIVMIIGTNKTYRIEADSDLATGVNSTNKNLIGAYPYLYGNGSAGLTGNPLYIAAGITKLIEVQGEKTVNLSFSNERAYFAYDADFPDLTSIIDPNGFEILGATFPATPTIANVIASGLDNNWTKSFKIYETSANVSMNGNFTFKH